MRTFIGLKLNLSMFINLHHMKFSLVKMLVIFLALLIFANELVAQELERFRGLQGYWQFSVGDNEEWLEVDFNDNDWDRLYVPGLWESQGYEEYNGFAWYRKTFKLSSFDLEKPIYLVLGKIDDVDEVFVNGEKIGQSGSFFPTFLTAYNTERIYSVPHSLLKRDNNNVIAVRVYDSHLNGGILAGDVGLYYDITNDLLEINLEGKWSFALSQPSNNINPKLSELEWTKINVPAKWEDEGFEEYDGYAVYMKTFVIPEKLAEDNLVLLLGRIDDYDYVYFNGRLIGTVFDLKKRGAYSSKGDEYQALRGYEIPKKYIMKNEKNTVIVKVYDYYKDGGIYEGPVGITTEEKFKYFERKYYRNITIWNLLNN